MFGSLASTLMGFEIQEIMSETSLGRYNRNPVMRVQKAEVGFVLVNSFGEF